MSDDEPGRIRDERTWPTECPSCRSHNKHWADQPSQIYLDEVAHPDKNRRKTEKFKYYKHLRTCRDCNHPYFSIEIPEEYLKTILKELSGLEYHGELGWSSRQELSTLAEQASARIETLVADCKLRDQEIERQSRLLASIIEMAQRKGQTYPPLSSNEPVDQVLAEHTTMCQFNREDLTEDNP